MNKNSPIYWGRTAWIFIFKAFEELDDIENLKFFVYLICSNLPCEKCKKHSLAHLEKNNLMNNNSITMWYIFFIELYNNFYTNNQINKNKINLNRYINIDKRNGIKIIFK